MIFMSDKVTRENNCRIASQETKIAIYGNPYIILLLTCYFTPWIYKSVKNNHRLLISPLSPRMVLSDLAL